MITVTMFRKYRDEFLSSEEKVLHLKQENQTFELQLVTEQSTRP
jgi:hypothetical protein